MAVKLGKRWAFHDFALELGQIIETRSFDNVETLDRKIDKMVECEIDRAAARFLIHVVYENLLALKDSP